MGNRSTRSDTAHIGNIVVLSGAVTNDPIRRTLRSGIDVVNFDVSTPVGGETFAVPVAWYDPSASVLSSFDVGEDVVVVGSVRRRFFRSGGLTQSRTEVVVDRLVPARRAKSARTAVAAVAARLTQADG